MNRPYDRPDAARPYDPSRHHRRSIRLRDYDYDGAGAYFVTIAVRGRDCLLGEVVNGEMRPSQIGEIVTPIWGSPLDRFPGVDLDEFCLMPNHVHGIIVILPAVAVGAVHGPPLRSPTRAQDRRRMLLPRIIGYFKMNTSKRANLLRGMPGQPFWQRDYYEHVIRDRADLERIREYIESNALRWDLDQLHPDKPSKW